MSPRRSLGYVTLEWTCPNCNTRNPGPQKTCSNCGAPQPDNVQFQRAAEEQSVTDQAAVHAAQAGADFICPYCGTRNRGDAKACSQCGGDLVEAKRRVAGGELQAYSGPRTVACPNCGTENPVANRNCSKCGSPLPVVAAAPAPAPAPAPSAPRVTGSAVGGKAPKKKTPWLLFGGIGAALLACCIGVFVLLSMPTSSVQGRVTDVYWKTSVPLEQQRNVRHLEEEGNPPGDAFDVSCHTESKQVCTEKVVDQGNGYGEKVQDCENVDKNYCSYTTKEWETLQTYTLDGHDYSPQYSQPSVSMDQRLGTQSVHYTVTFDTGKGQQTYSPGDLDQFKRFTIGSTWQLKLNLIGVVVRAEP